ncbi:MAG TPA: hypothetical protein VKP58_07135 [Candidatus Acidoferrum sp.]|jgi:hypothetical protein|nr:hypothetical protein [Candidatus Acidoferrum sp.]
MKQARREALKAMAGAAGLATLGAWFARAQEASQRNPSTASGEAAPDPGIDSKRAKTILEQNQKDIKRNIEKLFQLASELKDEVEKTDSVTVLSLAMLRKTEDIEKLARQIRDKTKG